MEIVENKVNVDQVSNKIKFLEKCEQRFKQIQLNDVIIPPKEQSEELDQQDLLAPIIIYPGIQPPRTDIYIDLGMSSGITLTEFHEKLEKGDKNILEIYYALTGCHWKNNDPNDEDDLYYMKQEELEDSKESDEWVLQ